MRRFLFGAIFIGCFFALGVGALDVHADEIHRYCLAERNDAPGQYVCMCADCGEVAIAVYASDISSMPHEEKPEGACTHFLQRLDVQKKSTIESVGNMHHVKAVWYDCVCAWCGYAFEAFMMDGNMLPHSYSVWEGVHLSGEDKHIYVSYCDDCGALNGQLFYCRLWEPDSCIDRHSRKLPLK